MAIDTMFAFLRDQHGEILRSWEELVLAEVRRVDLGGLALRDSIPEFLAELADWLESGAPPGGQKLGARSLKHVMTRLDQGFDLAQVMREYRLLREVILRRVLEAEQREHARTGSMGVPTQQQRIVDLARLNAGLDIAISGSIEDFVAERDRRAAADRARAEEALREKESRYRAVLDGMGEAFGLMDRELRIITQNETALRLDGRPLEAIVGRTHGEAYPDASPELVALYHRALAEGVPVSLEHRYDWQGRIPRWLEMRAFPVREGLAVFWRDISDRKAAEAALREATQRLTVATEAARLGVHDYDIASGALRWDARVREFFGVGPDEPVSYETFVAGLHPEDRVAIEAAVERALDPSGEGRFEAEYRVLSRTDGRQRWIAATGQTTFESGRATRLVGTAQDITERKKAKEALRDADRRKSEFLAVLSHELRNPLAPIRNSIYLLDRTTQGSQPFVRARKVIERQLNHLTRLVDDLLDVVRISRGRVELKQERVELRELVRQAMDALRPTFAQAGIELRVEHPLGPTWLDADPTRIAQVVGNLLHNAHKFTPAGGTVTVSLDSDSGKAYLRVKDTGVGMEPGREQEMFDAFAQGEQGLARTQGGLGLGLSLVKLFVELHGGTVAARSEGKGRGTEFVVSLPLATTEHQHARPVERPTPRSRRVLVIEDNPDAAQTLADVLALDGHFVQTAGLGVEGIGMAREHAPDVILCDVGLPDIDGYEVARRLRAIPGLEHVRLVALTGYAQPEERERALRAGFDDHFAKPLDPTAVGQALGPESRDR